MKKQAKPTQKAKPDVNAKNPNGWTPLHQAVKAGKLSEVQRLIQAGADVNAKNPNGWTPLHMAVEEGLIEITLELRKAGADPNIKDRDGNRPSDYTDSFQVKDALNGVLADQTLSLEGKCTAALVEASASLFTAITKLRQARDYADAVESLIILPLTEQSKEMIQKVEALIAARRSNH
jgi:ankyrin repeat protein